MPKLSDRYEAFCQEYLIAMCKVMVIAGQVVTYRSGWKRGRVARFAGKW